MSSSLNAKGISIYMIIMLLNHVVIMKYVLKIDACKVIISYMLLKGLCSLQFIFLMYIL